MNSMGGGNPMHYILSLIIEGNKDFLCVIAVMLLVSGPLVFPITSNDAGAEPVIIIEEKVASWDDTFNDTSGIYDMNDVSVNETRGDVTLMGYWNNFDTEPIGTISGWGYEYVGASYHHRVVEDPHEPGRCLYLAMNDNAAGYREHKVWKEFYKYWEILDFHLTPWQMEGTNRQAYFYIEFYNDTGAVIHEVRYYWDDNRSGVPASSLILTAIHLGWTLPTGGQDFGNIKYILHENISKDIEANPSADFENVLSNTTTFRYGFYQDAGPNWMQIDQVHIDDLGIHPANNKGNLTSVEISCPDDFTWKSIIVNKTEPGFDNFINITIVDGGNFEVIDTFSNLTDDIIDISSIDPAEHPTIRLIGYLVGNGSATPVLHNWTVTWIDVISIPTGLAVTNPLTGYSLILNWNPNPEPDIVRYILYYSTDNITFHSLANVSAYTFSFTHYGLDIGTNYYYKIAAGDDVPSQSLFSEVVEGVPDRDFDGDGIADMGDTDDDNDGVPDIDDPYPYSNINDMEITLDNLTTDVESLRLWLENAIANVEGDINATNETLHQQLAIQDALMTNFYDNLTTDLGDIHSDLILHDQNTGQDHSDIIALLNDILDGQIEKEKIAELRTMLIDLAGNLSEHNQTIADDILDVVDDIDEFETQTDAQLERINHTLEDLEKLNEILGGLHTLEQSLDQAEEDIQDSIDERSTKKEDEERFVLIGLFLIILLIFLVINMVLTILTRKKIDTIKEMRGTMDMEEMDREIEHSAPDTGDEETERTPPRPPSTV